MTGEQYLLNHNIDQTFAREKGLKWNKDVLTFPVNDEEGNFAFTKTRNLKHEEDNTIPKYTNAKDSKAVLFNYYAVKDNPNIVLCEGEIDCIKLLSEGIPSVSSTGGSNTFILEWVELLRNKNLYVCYDNDKAGREGIQSLVQLLPNTKVIRLPVGVKDVCDYFTAHTKKDFYNLIREAQTKEEWEIANIPEEFSIQTVAEIRKKEIKPDPWLIDKVLYEEGFCFIYGTEGVGKSFIVLDMARAIADGGDWLGHFKTKQTNVLIIDKENPEPMVQERLQGFNMDQSNIFYLKYPEGFGLVGNKGEYSEFAKSLKIIIANKKIGAIIIDSFIDLMVGEESGSGDTQQFFQAIRELYPHLAYITITHENKPQAGNYRTSAQKLRGSSNINAQASTIFRIEGVAKSRTDITLEQVKSRGAKKLEKFLIRMVVEDLEDESTAVKGFEYVGEVAGKSDDKDAEAEEMVVNVLSDNDGSLKEDLVELGKGAGISDATIERVLKRMVASEEVERQTKGKKAFFTLINPIVKKEDFEGQLDL